MHVVANGISPSDTALGSFRTLRVTKEICARTKSCMSSNLSQYYSFLLIYSPLILKQLSASRNMVRICFLTRKSFSESFVLCRLDYKMGTICSRGRPWVVTMDGPGGPSAAPWTVRSDRL